MQGQQLGTCLLVNGFCPPTFVERQRRNRLTLGSLLFFHEAFFNEAKCRQSKIIIASRNEIAKFIYNGICGN